MVGFPNKPMGFPTKNDHFGVWNGGTTILGNTQTYYIILPMLYRGYILKHSKSDPY